MSEVVTLTKTKGDKMLTVMDCFFQTKFKFVQVDFQIRKERKPIASWKEENHYVFCLKQTTVSAVGIR